MEWNYDLSTAPRGRNEKKIRTSLIKGKVIDQSMTVFVQERVLLSHKDGNVYASYWVPADVGPDGKVRGGNRWSGLNHGEEPLAWMPFPPHCSDDIPW